jgi:hypothetical protein
VDLAALTEHVAKQHKVLKIIETASCRAGFEVLDSKCEVIITETGHFIIALTLNGKEVNQEQLEKLELLIRKLIRRFSDDSA